MSLFVFMCVHVSLKDCDSRMANPAGSRWGIGEYIIYQCQIYFEVKGK